MNIQRLIYFLAVANNLSFTKAARECHIAQTAMSRQITMLENELDVKLFERDNRHVSLTDAGKEFYWHASHLVEIYKEAIERMEIVSHKRKYNLKIGIGPYESLLLAPYLKGFSELFPQIDLSCFQFNYEQLSTQLQNGTIDLMFCINHCADRVKGCETILLYDGPWAIISEANHRFGHKPEVGYRDLVDEVLVSMNEYNFDDYKKQFSDHDSQPANFIRVNTHTAKVLLVQAGLGVALVPQFVGESLPKDVNFTPFFDKIHRSFHCAYFPTKRSPAYQQFIDYIRAKSDMLL